MRAGSAPVDRRLADALRACRGAFIAVLVFSLGISLLMLTAPLYMMHLSDHVLPSRSNETLLVLSGICVFALIVFGILEGARSHVMVGIGTWLDRRLGSAVLLSSVQQALRETNSSGQGLRDLGTVRQFLTGPALLSFFDSPWTPIFVAVIYGLHPTLGAVALASALVLFALAILNEYATRGALKRANSESIRALASAEAAIRNADAIEAMGMMPNLQARWHRDNSYVLDLQARAAARTNHISAVSKTLRLFLQIAMLGVGAYLAIAGEITPGVMIAASILVGRALAPVEQAIGAARTVAGAWAAYKRLGQQLEAAPPRTDMLPLPRPVGRLAAEGVLYAHPGSKEPLLRAISFDMEPGLALGLIGPSGSGKTTLARLLVGNLRPNVGHVRLDDADVAEWNPDDRGQYVGYLPQNVELFPGTVRDNIARLGDVDAESVIAAAQLAGVHEMILRLPRGYETEVAPGGLNLSGGERQRIALARALFGDPRLVVLDEPNAALDAQGEDALLGVIDRLRDRKITSIVIAHRPNILRHVDSILVLRDGQIRLFGARDEILPRVITGGEPVRTELLSKAVGNG